MIPLLFAVQKLVEGGIWLTLVHDVPRLQQTLTYVYSICSHVLWPIHVPLAIGILETVRWRRRVLASFEAAGPAAGLFLLFFIVTRPVVAPAVSRHIEYVSPHVYITPVISLYVAATCLSGFFSSHSFMRLFGGLALLSFVATYSADVCLVLSCGPPEHPDVRPPAVSRAWRIPVSHSPVAARV